MPYTTIFVNELQENRKTLIEGRTSGVSFAFCNRVSRVDRVDGKRNIINTFITIQPISACKDYLNDVIYNETTGIPINAFELKLDAPLGLMRKSTLALAMTVLNNSNNNVDISSDIKLLGTSVESGMLEEFMQKLERKLIKTFKGKLTTIVKSDVEGVYIVRFSKYWGQYAYLISLYALFLRVGIYYSDKNIDVLEWLKTANLNPMDKVIMLKVLPKYEKLIELTEVPEQDYKDLDGYKNDLFMYHRTIHNQGISGFKKLD